MGMAHCTWYLVRCIGAGVEVPVLPGPYWRDVVYHFQLVGNVARHEDPGDGLPVLRTASLAVHTATRFHAHQQGASTLRQLRRRWLGDRRGRSSGKFLGPDPWRVSTALFSESGKT